MRPIKINNDLWLVERVPPWDPLLIDRTGKPRLATTDPLAKVIRISSSVLPPLLDKVLLHEVSHAITISYGLLPYMSNIFPHDYQVIIEEWSVGFLENYGIEAAILASRSLNRPLCISGYCIST